MNKRMDLTNKVAIITGASQGLGEQLAVELASEGVRVVLAARNRARLEAIKRRIEGAGGTALVSVVDLQSEEQCKRLIAETVAGFGQIDILVLNAGTATYGRLDELENLDPIRRSMAINFLGAAYPTYFALEHLIAGKGTIAYVTSGAGHLPMAGYLGYSTSKHAMNGFFEALRLETFPHDVNVLAINPGDMYSEDGAGRTVIGPDGREAKVDLSVKRANDISRVPAGEVAKKCVAGIAERKREVDLSPRIQKLATVLRPIAPKPIDRRIYGRAKKMRSAFTAVKEELDSSVR